MKRLLRKPRFLIVYPLAMWLAVTASTSEWSLRLGSAVVLLGEALRLWANGYVGHVKVNVTSTSGRAPKIGRLITAGPYAYVRNPLYLGTFLIGLGFCVAVRNAWLAASGLAVFTLIYRRKIAQEEALIAEEWAEAYRAYHRAVPRWLPVRRRYAHRHGRWSWQGIGASQELKTVVWVIVGLLAVYLREEIVQEGEWRWHVTGLKHLVIAALMLLLMAGDGVAELVQRARRKRAAVPI